MHENSPPAEGVSFSQGQSVTERLEINAYMYRLGQNVSLEPQRPRRESGTDPLPAMIYGLFLCGATHVLPGSTSTAFFMIVVVYGA